MFKKVIAGLVILVIIMGVIFFWFEETHNSENESTNEEQSQNTEIKDTKDNLERTEYGDIVVTARRIDTTEYNKISKNITIKSLDFEGIPDDQKQEFINKQSECINNIVRTLDEMISLNFTNEEVKENEQNEEKDSDFKIDTQIKQACRDDILTVMVKYSYPSMLGPIDEEMVVLNYSVKEKKALSNLELLTLKGYVANIVASQLYKEFCKSPYVMKASDNETQEVMSDVFETSADKYVKRIEDNLNKLNMYMDGDKVIACYTAGEPFKILSVEYGIGLLIQYKECELVK